jgi:hypothetical protein
MNIDIIIFNFISNYLIYSEFIQIYFKFISKYAHCLTAAHCWTAAHCRTLPGALLDSRTLPQAVLDCRTMPHYTA